MKRIFKVGIFLILTGAFCLAKEDSAEVRVSRIENGLTSVIRIKGRPVSKMKLEDRMRYYHIPGVSVAFFDHGGILWTRTYGFANIRERKPVTPETLFQAGSISKPTTALAALRLVQDGKLSLDEDVNLKLVTWKVPENEFTREQKVTLRRLLSHTAGINIHGFRGYARGEPVPDTLAILRGEKPANTPPIQVVAVPGTAWSYSGGGYAIVQLLLTDVTHERFPRLLKEVVLDPAGMTHSTFEEPLPRALWPSAATPYDSHGEPVRGGSYVYPEMAAAGLWTTASDLALMAIEVENEYLGKSEQILSQKMAREMLSQQKGNWGLGFSVRSSDSQWRFGHGGSDEGFESQLVAYTDSQQGIAIMTNGDRGSELIGELLAGVAEEYGWPDFQPVEHNLITLNSANLKPFVGTYRIPNEVPGQDELTVRMKHGVLLLQNGDPDSEELLPESETQFFTLSDPGIFTFQKNDKGAVTALVVQRGSDETRAIKISNLTVK